MVIYLVVGSVYLWLKEGTSVFYVKIFRCLNSVIIGSRSYSLKEHLCAYTVTNVCPAIKK